MGKQLKKVRGQLFELDNRNPLGEGEVVVTRT